MLFLREFAHPLVVTSTVNANHAKKIAMLLLALQYEVVFELQNTAP
jgi:hypothetical protein